MRDDLGHLLQQHPKSRTVFPHLGMLEAVLKEGSLVAIDELAPDVLAHALSDMERLVKDWSPPGLAELRSRVAVLVRRNAAARMPPPAPPVKPAAAAVRKDTPAPIEERSSGPEITEVGHDDFEEMERSWRGILPPDVPGPPS